MFVVAGVAFLVAAMCYQGSCVLRRKAVEAFKEADNFHFQNRQASIQFTRAGGVDALESQLGFEEQLRVARLMMDDNGPPRGRAYYVRRLFGPDFESVDEQANDAAAKAFRYSMCASLCTIGAWVAGATAFVAVIYPFLS